MTITISKNKTLTRFGDLFGAGGFKRLVNEGALFTNANYDYVPTFTACGHAAISSGSVPAVNGIVGNAYFDREAGKVVIMVADESAHLVNGKAVSTRGGAASPDAYRHDHRRSDLLGVEPPSNRTGRVLVEALATPIQGNAASK